MPATKIAVLAIVILICNTAFPCDDPPDHYQNPCRIGTMTSYDYLFVARELGFFRENKIDANIVLMANAQALFGAIAGGEVQVSNVSAATTLNAIFAGLTLKIVATPRSRIQVDLWSRGSIKSLKQLEGRVIAVGGPGSGQSVALEQIFKASGLNVQNYKLSGIPNTNERVGSIAAGKYEAGMFPAGLETRLKERGLTKIVSSKPIEYARDVIAVQEKIFQDKRNTSFLVGLVRSIAASITFLRNADNRDRSLGFIEKHRGVSRDAAQDIYLDYTSVPDADIEASLRGMEAVIRDLALSGNQNPQAKSLQLSNIVTQEIVQLAKRK